MKKRWIPFIALTLVLIFAGGILLGSATESEQQTDFWVARMNIQNTIAVVNADVGAINERGERLNYSAAIIQALEEEFTQASPALAETGFLDGTFGAIITFPSHVSQRVLTFNDRYPQRIQLEFVINPNLPEREYIETYLRILNLQMSINTTLAHTYVSSIFMQFHQAQNQVGDIFQNKEDNLTAMNIISLEQFTPSLNLDYIPQIPFEPESYDGSRHLTSIEGFAYSVASLYKNSYSAASASYLAMREGLLAMTEEIPLEAENWLTNLQVWAEEWEEYGEVLIEQKALALDLIDDLNELLDDLEVYLEELEELVNEANEFFDDLSAWHARLENNYSILDTFYDALLTNIDYINDDIANKNAFLAFMVVWYGHLNEWYERFDQWQGAPAWFDDVNDRHNELQAQLTAVMNQRPYSGDFYPYVPGYPGDYEAAVGDWFLLVVAVSVETMALLNELGTRLGVIPLPDVFNHPLNDFEYYNPDLEPPEITPPISLEGLAGLIWDDVDHVELYMDGFEPEVPEALDPFDFDEVQPEESAPASAEGFLNPLHELRSQLEAFNVEDFLADEIWNSVEGQIAGFGTYLDFVRDGLGFHVESNNMLLSMIYFEYTNYLMGLRQDAFAAEAYEMTNLHERLEEFYEIHDATRLDTIARLIDFSGMMPESRTEAGINRALIEHSITPFEFTPPVLRGDVTSEMFAGDSLYDRFGQWLWAGGLLVLLVFFVTLSTHFVSGKKKGEN